MRGKLLDRGTRSSSEKLGRSKSQEERAATDLGGKRTPASGAMWSSKGDVKARRFLVECKRTEAASYTLKLSELTKIHIEAMQAGKEPAMQVEFGKSRFAVIPWNLFVALTAQRSGDE